MGHSFGYNRNEPLSNYRTGKELVWILIDLVSRGGNFLLDVGPTADGRIPELQQDRLLELGAWLEINGEAIFGTRTWETAAQWTAGERPAQGYGQYREKYDILELAGAAPVNGKARKEVFFTRKGRDLYAITPGRPQGKLVLKGVRAPKEAEVSLLGLDRALAWKQRKNNLVISVPALSADEGPGRHAYAFKIPGGAGD